MALPFFTIGHSTRTVPEFVDLLRQGGVGLVVDIRTVPRSRTNPGYNLDSLPEALAGYQIDHRRIEALGGLRKKSAEIPPDVNGYWINQSFHNYADHALSPAFGDGLAELIALGRERRTAMMCSEAVWWRCHRRIVADYLLLGGEQVFHLMGKDRVNPAKPTPAARRRDDGRIDYPGSAT